MLRKLLTPARPTNHLPADVHHFNNQLFPSENLVKNFYVNVNADANANADTGDGALPLLDFVHAS